MARPGKLASKWKNRPFFEKSLVRNIARSTKQEARRIRGRVLLELRDGVPQEEIRERLKRVFGIAYFAFAYKIPLNPPLLKGEKGGLESLKEEILNKVEGMTFPSFGVITRRSNKNFPHTSQEVNEIVGRVVQERTKAKVDLDHPHLPIHIEILEKEALFYFEKISGPGGLPVGVSGKVACLLSGGIDSPVSAYQMLKRGCEILFIHFHSAPFTSTASQEKVKEVVEILTPYQFTSHVYFIPFAELQQEITTQTPAPYRVILYRRFMVRIAEVLARQEGALALVTGDAIGQVASQTLPNLSTIQSAANLPILRPLIGMDKQEIIRLAQKIGTYETSIQPHEDCCSYLMPREPVTHSTPKELLRIEEAMDVKGWVSKILSQVSSQVFHFPTS
ncbi:tRNA 4-thiouridine(8) synthase ThiI [candidate division TA06 bacterium]|nr:tRNA 4-thiouridine(8) synthase ThiI [candidate division TA06 bacterium]